MPKVKPYSDPPPAPKPGRFVVRDMPPPDRYTMGRVVAFPGTTTLDQLADWLGGEGTIGLMYDTADAETLKAMLTRRAAKLEELLARRSRAEHAMQSGVAADIGHDDATGTSESCTTLKHLRVSINVAMVDHGALIGLLVRKGVITNLEYVEAMAEAMEAEQKRYEAHLSRRLGTSVTLA